MRRMRRLIYISLAILIALPVILIGALFAYLQTDNAHRQLLTLLQQQTANGPIKVEAQRIEGTIPFDMRITGIKLSDAKGAWLEADYLHLAWSPGDLLSHRVRIDDLSAGVLTLNRLPDLPPSPEQPKADKGPLLPSLPVDIDLRRLNIDRIDLGAPILGETASFTASANATLGRPIDGLQADLALQRIDRDNDRVKAHLAYRPADDVLDLQLQAHEPEGGLITQLIGLTGKHNLQIDAQGDGVLSDWHGRIAGTLDGQSLLSLDLSTSGTAASRKVTFNASGDPTPILPPNIAGLLTGGIKAQGQVQLDDTVSLIHIDELRIESQAATVTAKGTVGTDQAGALDLQVTSDNAAAFADLLPEIGWQHAVIDAKITGRIDAPNAEITANVSDLATDGNRIGTTSLNLTATPRGSLQDPIDLSAKLSLSDVAPGDDRLKPLTDAGADLAITGSLTTAGLIDLQKIDLHAGQITLSAMATATGWGADSVKASGTLTADDITALAALGGIKGKGALHLAVTAENGPAGAKLMIDGQSRDLSLGQPVIDGLLGTTPKLTVDAERDATGQITVRQMTVMAKSLTAEASGSALLDKIDLQANVKLTDLAALDRQASGRLTLQAKAGGTMQAPVVDLTVTAPKVAYAQYVLNSLNLTAKGQDLLTAPRADMALKARFNDLPASVNAKLQSQSTHGPFALNDFMARLGATSLRGQAVLTDGLTKGKFSLNGPDLAEIGRLAGISLGGSITADLSLAPDARRQSANLTVKLDQLAVEDNIKVKQTQLTAKVADAFGAANMDARMTLNDVTVPQRHFDTAAITAKGSLARLAVTATASGADTALDMAALVNNDAKGQVINLSRLNLSLQQEKLALKGPAQIELRQGTTSVKNLAVTASGGSLALNATLGRDQNDIDLQLQKLPLSLARIADPSLRVTGALNGNLRLSGPHGAPTAQLTLTASNVGQRDIPARPINIKLTGNWRNGQMQGNGHVDLGDADSKLDASWQLPLPADRSTGLPAFDPKVSLQAQAKGKVDLALANPFLAGGADRVTGHAVIDMAATGPITAPILKGGVDLQGGRYENVRYGVKLGSIQAKLQANGPQIDLVSLTAKTPGGGNISGAGQVSLIGDRKVSLNLKADQAQMVDTQLASAVTDADLSVHGDLNHRVFLSGGVKIRKAEIRIPDSLPPSIQEIQVVEINASPQQLARLDAQQQAPSTPLRINLDLTVDAPQQVSIHGRGLDAEMGGKLTITGTAATPIVTGVLKMRRGTLDLVGRHLNFDHGQVTFDGGEVIDPLLDFEAKTTAENYDIVIAVGGSANKPKFTLTSTPSLPQDEIMARLLFGKAAGSLSPFEALQLAQAVASLAGVDTGTGILDRLRQATGLDRLSIDSGDDSSRSGKSNGSGPSLSAGRYVSDGVYVGVKQGAQVGSSVATVQIDITPHVQVETDVGADAGSRAGINLQWDY